MKKLSIAALLVLALPIIAMASNFNYISQDDMRARLQANDDMHIVDICPVPLFAEKHLPGSVETNAYPVKSDEERAKLTPLLGDLTADSNDIVIVCPGGKGGAQRTYEYFVENGIDEGRLLILEHGMKGWPYETESK